MKQVIELSKILYDLGYFIQDAIDIAINIIREKEQNEYETGGLYE